MKLMEIIKKKKVHRVFLNLFIMSLNFLSKHFHKFIYNGNVDFCVYLFIMSITKAYIDMSLNFLSKHFHKWPPPNKFSESTHMDELILA
jgi:hypothetical protein